MPPPHCDLDARRAVFGIGFRAVDIALESGVLDIRHQPVGMANANDDIAFVRKDEISRGNIVHNPAEIDGAGRYLHTDMILIGACIACGNRDNRIGAVNDTTVLKDIFGHAAGMVERNILNFVQVFRLKIKCAVGESDRMTLLGAVITASIAITLDDAVHI